MTGSIFHDPMKSRGGELRFKNCVFCCQVDKDSSCDSGDNLTGSRLVPCTPVRDCLASGHTLQVLHWLGKTHLKCGWNCSLGDILKRWRTWVSNLCYSVSWLWMQCDQMLHTSTASISPTWGTEPGSVSQNNPFFLSSCLYHDRKSDQNIPLLFPFTCWGRQAQTLLPLSYPFPHPLVLYIPGHMQWSYIQYEFHFISKKLKWCKIGH